MADRDALLVTLDGGWSLLAAGVRRERNGDLTADLSLQNGTIHYADRAALNRAPARQAFAEAAIGAATPPACEIADALIVAQEDREPRRSQADELVALARDVALYHDEAHAGYARVPIESHVETWPLRSSGFNRWLRGRFYAEHAKAPGAQAVQDALSMLESHAQFKGERRSIYVRVAPDGQGASSSTWPMTTGVRPTSRVTV